MSDEFFLVDTDLESAEFPATPKVPDNGYVTYVDHLTGAPGAHTLSPDAVDSMGYVQSIPVDPVEAVRWMEAHAHFKSELDHAHTELRAAMVRWNEAVEVWQARLAAATAEYLPVSEEIKHRKDRVGLERLAHEERQAEMEQAAREVSMEAEAAVFGPREWMYIAAEPQRVPPIIHRITCSLVAKALESNPSPYLRKRFGLVPLNLDEVLAKKQDETRLCGRCHAAHHLEQAQLQRQ